jgi:AraC-like DNA-binding protein
MIADLYNDIKSDPSYNKLVGKDYLIVEYKCPIDTEKFQLLTEMNFILYIISGRKDLITADKMYEVREGEALFLRKGVYTTHQHFEVDNCVLIFFLSDDFIRNFVRENSSIMKLDSETVQDQIFELNVDETLKTCFYSVYNYLKMYPGIPQNLVEIKFKELLFNIVLNPAHKQLVQFFTSLNETNKSNLDQVMMKNFQHDIALEDFARLCGRSLSAFKRDFKNYYHESPGKWLTNKRLDHARNLLLSTDLNISEIGYQSGFKNSSHFNRAFKDKFQTPPKQFRSQSKAT